MQKGLGQKVRKEPGVGIAYICVRGGAGRPELHLPWVSEGRDLPSWMLETPYLQAA